MPGGAVLTLDNVNYHEGDFELRADWQLQQGQKLALIGPSGAGKSTLLSLISGFLRPQSGRIFWEGQDLSGLKPGKRPLSILFQDQNLLPHLTVAQNIGLGLRPDLRLSAKDKEQIEQALAKLGLGGLGARRPAQLSGGQASRAALARVLLRRRPLLLLDEPFSALGPALRQEMLVLLEDLVADHGITVLMVTHDPKDALAFADQTVLVAQGQAAPPISTRQLFENPPDQLRAYLGAPG